MSTNEFLPVAIDPGANVESQADYTASVKRTLGYDDGDSPDAAEFNKMIRQAAFVMSQVAQAMSDILSQNVLDDGDAAAFLAQFKAMLNTRPAVSTANAQAAYADSGMPPDTTCTAAAGYLYTVSLQGLGVLANSNGTPITPIIDVQIKDGVTVLATVTTNYQSTAVPTGFSGVLPFGGIVENLPAPASGSYTFHTVDSESDGGSHSWAKTSIVASVSRSTPA